MAKSYFNDNLSALTVSAPRLATKMRFTNESHLCVSEDIRFVEAKTGAIAAECRIGDAWVALVSKYDPEKQAESFVDAMQNMQAECYVVFGLQCGYTIRALLARISDTQRIVVIAPERNLCVQQLYACPLDDVLSDPRVRIIQADDPARAIQSLCVFLWVHKSASLSVVVPPVMQQLFPAYTKTFQQLLAEEQAVISKERAQFADGSQKIKAEFFNEQGMMGELDQFFKRIEQKQAERPLSLVESCYLMIKMFFYYKSYEENTA